ncbi:MAG: exodeoxyribonuclease VII large subunit [Ruminococcus sp.]|nr:exodeoxyribonuclease VII large subunit [Ruminococcus sp.]
MLILSVSQINRYLAFKFKEDKKLCGVMIRGEISNFTAHRSGHLYFTLKDKESAVKAVMFKSSASRLKFMPESGMNVIVMGTVSVFERDGVYQVYVTDIIPDGAGEVHVANEQLKKKLAAAGVFDEAAKRPIPQLPSKIGVVTSRTGAALQDIINILSRRYPIAELAIVPALVQGENAPESISSALVKAGKLDCDVIILARGGGSLEDLSAFNTEVVAYAIFNSSVPVISAVGHETDYTIADMAADLRVPTPSAAAEMVSVSKEQLEGNLRYYDEKLKSCVMAVYEAYALRLDRLNDRLLRFSPKQKMDADIQKLDNLTRALKSAYARIISEKNSSCISAASKMEALSPVKVLERGYSLVYRDGNVITKSSELSAGDYIEIKMSDGVVRAKILSDGEEQ